MKNFLLKFIKNIVLQIVSLIIIIWAVAFATISWPTNSPTWEVIGWKFQEYFDKIFNWSCPTWQAIAWYDSNKDPICIATWSGTIGGNWSWWENISLTDTNIFDVNCDYRVNLWDGNTSWAKYRNVTGISDNSIMIWYNQITNWIWDSIAKSNKSTTIGWRSVTSIEKRCWWIWISWWWGDLETHNFFITWSINAVSNLNYTCPSDMKIVSHRTILYPSWDWACWWWVTADWKTAQAIWCSAVSWQYRGMIWTCAKTSWWSSWRLNISSETSNFDTNCEYRWKMMSWGSYIWSYFYPTVVKNDLITMDWSAWNYQTVYSWNKAQSSWDTWTFNVETYERCWSIWWWNWWWWEDVSLTDTNDFEVVCEYRIWNNQSYQYVDTVRKDSILFEVSTAQFALWRIDKINKKKAYYAEDWDFDDVDWNRVSVVWNTSWNIPWLQKRCGWTVSNNSPTKAWVQFDSNGTILASDNVLSVVKTSEWYFTINYINPLSSPYYAVNVDTTNIGYSAGASVWIDSAVWSQTTSYVKIFTMLGSNIWTTTPYSFPTTSVVITAN